MTVHETNCIIKYTTWPSSGVTVDNEMGDATYDGTEDANRYTTTPSGASAQAQTANTNYIYTTGTAVNAITLEWLVKYDSSCPTSAYLFSDYNNNFKIYYEKSTDRLYIYRKDYSEGKLVDEWYGTAGFTNGNWYEVQISWQGYGYTPVLRINNNNITLTVITANAVGPWPSSTYFAILYGPSSSSFIGTITVFRLHTTNLSNAYLEDNYNNDWVRTASGGSVTAVVATATATAPTPAVSTPSEVSAIVATATASAPAPVVTGGADADVTAVVATATAAGITPVVAGEAAGGAHEDHAVIKYTTWPVTGTAVTNEGIGGVTGNATLDACRPTTTPSGASAQIISASTHYIEIGSSPAINTLPAFTAEWLLRYNSGGGFVQYLFAKDVPFVIRYISGNILGIVYHRIYLIRTDTGLNSDAWYVDYTFTNGAWYEIQISWGVIGSTPLLKINDANQSLTHQHIGSGAWQNDSAYHANVCNANTHDSAFWCTLTIFRLHNINLSTEYLTDNYTEDWTRTVAPAPSAIVLAVAAQATAAGIAPVFSSDYNCDAVVATATAECITPTVEGAEESYIIAVPATATASMPAPAIHIGMGMAISYITAVQIDDTSLEANYITESELVS